MRILALDPASTTGFCHGEPGETPISGVYRSPKLDRVSARSFAFKRWLGELIRANEIKRVYFEKPILPKVTSLDAMLALCGKAIVIGLACEEHAIHAIPIDMQSWRSEFGTATQAPKRMKGSAERRAWVKQATLDRCRVLGFDPKTQDEADAVGLWIAMANRHLKPVREPQLRFDEAAP